MRLAAAALALALLPAGAAAQELEWSDSWARVHPASYPAQSIGVAAALVFDQLYEPPDDANVVGPWLFDAPVRDALRARGEEDRERAASFSDVLLGVLLAWPVVDALAVAGLGRGSSDVAWQLVSITSEVVAFDFILSTLVKAFVHRERPHGDRCTREDRRTRPGRCGPRGRTRSFYSGHASAGFAYAGVVCMAHAHVPIYGDAGADAFACGAAMATASITSVLRMLADRHFATDVISGAVIGLATGLLLPYLLHYGWDPRDDIAPAPMPVSTGPAPVTLSWSGRF